MPHFPTLALCGGLLSLKVVVDIEVHLVLCETCGGRGPSKPTEAEAVAGWNRRAGVEGERPRG